MVGQRLANRLVLVGLTNEDWSVKVVMEDKWIGYPRKHVPES